MWPFRHGVLVSMDFDVALLIDMQPHFLRKLQDGVRARIISAQVTVIRHCVARGIPLMLVEYHGGGMTVNELRDEMPRDMRSCTIIKRHNNGFSCTELHARLQNLRAESLLLMGVNASGCVYLTAHSAINKGYKVITAYDLIADEGCVMPHEAEETMRWYRKNCILVQNSMGLISQAA